MKPVYLMRHMQVEDIPQVIDIDQASFPIPWSRRTYEHEIENRGTAQMIVVETNHLPVPARLGLWGWFQQWRTPRPTSRIVGYGGCWLIAGEAHISTIAVHPEFRGQGLGELLLAGMLQRAITLQADYSVLEVRVSNENAQALYRKYEYQVVGRRRRYYRDNDEDALLMEARPLDSEYQQRMNQRIAELKQRLDFVDQFTTIMLT